MNAFGRFLGALIALVFIFVGVALLLGNLGFLVVDPVELIVDFWPVVLIATGLYIIWLFVRPAQMPKGVTLSESLGGAARADITIDFGAGELRISPLKENDNLFEGGFVTKPEKQVSRSGDSVRMKLTRLQWTFPPFSRWADNWRVGLTTKIPLILRLNTGASRVFVDLTDNLVELVELNTGASEVAVQFPKASGYTRAVVKGGATNIRLETPQGVAARIKSTGALGSLNVDEKRFPRSNGLFVSPDFESAQNKVDVEISAGVSSVTVV